MKKLIDICDIQYGYAFDSVNFTNDKSYLPLVRIRDVKRGYSETFYKGEYPEEYVVHKDDLLVGMDGEFNIARWRDRDALLNQRVCKISAKQDNNGEYIRFALMRILKKIEDKTAFVTVKHLSAKELNKVAWEIPGIEKQNEIANTLDILERILESRQEELKKLDDFVRARFVEMFGDMYLNTLSWSEVQLETVADIVSGITKGRKVKEQELIEVPYMAVSNVKDGYIDWTTIKTIEATEQEIEQYRLLPDDVLMTEGGDPDKVGRGAIIRNPLENCIHQNHIFRVRLNEKMILPTFFAEYLQHQRSKRYFLGCAKQTTGIASINMKQLRALPVLLPPLELQQQFSDFVIGVDKSKVVVQKALDEAQLLFDSLMQQYFG
ncbi:restriction endonuclease subunit S [bacterium 210820-DFI.6.38]|nr:restriction endonuclease subunit S [bacterium 210820-DFI.6.38]